jgi:hypothetical protein
MGKVNRGGRIKKRMLINKAVKRYVDRVSQNRMQWLCSKFLHS